MSLYAIMCEYEDQAELLPVVARSIRGAQIAAQAHLDTSRDDNGLLRVALFWTTLRGGEVVAQVAELPAPGAVSQRVMYTIQPCEEIA